MRTWSALVLSIIAALCLWQAANGDAQQPSEVTISAKLDRVRALSTEDVSASFVISNNSKQRLTFFWPIDVYALRQEDGRWNSSPIFNGMSFPNQVHIRPGMRNRSSVTMPSCPVFSDPCRQTVIIEVHLRTDTGKLYTAQSAPLQYEFVPDPTATYAVNGLRANRPVFLVRGVGADTVQPDSGEQFASRTTSTVHYLVVGRAENETLRARADADAGARATRLSTIVGAGNVIGVATDAGRVYVRAHVEQFPYGDPGTPDDESPLILHQPSFVPTPVELERDSLFIGEHSVVLPEDKFIDDRAGLPFANEGGWEPTPMSLHLDIAADRPELFVVGHAIASRALRAGFTPEFVSIRIARAYSVLLARLLDVRLGQPSLFVEYPGTRDVYIVGLGSTFSGGDVRQMQSQRVDPQIAAAAGQDGKLEPEISLPITIPDDATAITETATAISLERPDAVRLNIDVTAVNPPLGAATIPGAPPEQLVVKRLRTIPGMTEVLVMTPDIYERQYSLTIRPSDLSLVKRAIATIKQAYMNSAVQIRTSSISGISLHCRALERRAIIQSIREATIKARADAAATHRRLRKLLVAALFPIDVDQGACDTHGYPFNGGGEPIDVPPQMPERVRFIVTLTLGFRMFAAYR